MSVYEHAKPGAGKLSYNIHNICNDSVLRSKRMCSLARLFRFIIQIISTDFIPRDNYTIYSVVRVSYKYVIYPMSYGSGLQLKLPEIY